MIGTVPHYRDIFGRLRSVRPRLGYWTAACPCHKGGMERRPSLSLWLRNGRLLVRCHACGARVDAVAAALGVPVAMFFEDYRERKGRRMAAQPAKIVQTYDYFDETGELLYQVCRLEPKSFVQRRPDPAGGWVWGLGGVRRVLYRLPDLLERFARWDAQPATPRQYVAVVEGEKDADALWALGLAATTNACGAGKWEESFSSFLAGRRVLIFPDDDEAGRKHAILVAGSLVLAGALSLRIVPLPAKDVSDYLSDFPAGVRPEQRLDALLAHAWAARSWICLPRAGEERGEVSEPAGHPGRGTSAGCRAGEQEGADAAVDAPGAWQGDPALAAAADPGPAASGAQLCPG